MEPPILPPAPIVPSPAQEIPAAAPPKARQLPSISSQLFERLTQALNAALNALDCAWRFVKNPVDHDWRKNQKYQHLMQEMRAGFEDQLVNGMFPHPKIKQMVDLIKQTPGRPIVTAKYDKGSMKECRHHLEKALRILYDKQVSFDSERERYKAFTKSYLKALSTPYYKNLVKEGQGGLAAEQMRALEQNNTLIGALHSLAYVQFSRVNTLGFTQSVANEMAKVGGYKDQPNRISVSGTPREKSAQLFGALERECVRTQKASVAIDQADSRYNISKWTKFGATIKGHMSFMDFDPLHTGGNPANIHHKRRYPDGSEITFVRLPTPTIGSDISPDFKAYLRALKSRGETHGYFNLQDRRTPKELPHTKDKIKAGLGFPREDLRVDSLESLNTDPEFAGVIHVFSLDKNSPFYWQHHKKAGHALLDNLIGRNIVRDPAKIQAFKKGIDNKNDFAKTFDQLLSIYHSHSPDKMTDPAFAMQQRSAFVQQLKHNMFGKSSSFFIPPDILEAHRGALESHLDDLAEMYFGDRKYLSPSRSQNFIELSYDLMTDYLIRELKVNYANISCKDCIDRGEGQLALKEGKDLIMEILHTPDGNFREGLLQDIQAWHETVHAAAIWARKRRILPEREVRLINAMKCMLEMVRTNPQRFQQVNQAAQKGIPVVEAPVNAKQRVKEFMEDMTGFPEDFYANREQMPNTLSDLFDQAMQSQNFPVSQPQPAPDSRPHLGDEDQEVIS